MPLQHFPLDCYHDHGRHRYPISPCRHRCLFTLLGQRSWSVSPWQPKRPTQVHVRQVTIMTASHPQVGRHQWRNIRGDNRENLLRRPGLRAFGVVIACVRWYRAKGPYSTEGNNSLLYPVAVIIDPGPRRAAVKHRVQSGHLQGYQSWTVLRSKTLRISLWPSYGFPPNVIALSSTFSWDCHCRWNSMLISRKVLCRPTLSDPWKFRLVPN